MRKRSADIQCNPNGASPRHNRMLEKHGFPPQAIEECDDHRQLQAPKDQREKTPKKSRPPGAG